MSAAASGRGASRTSCKPFEQDLPGARQDRDGQLAGEFARRARAPPRVIAGVLRRARARASARDEMHEFGEFDQDLRRVGADVVLLLEDRQRRRACRPSSTASNRSMTRARSARPSIARKSSARTPAAPDCAPCAIAWSSSDSASRTEPSAARAISASASGSTATPSLAQMLARWRTSTSVSMRRRSKRRQRERTVTGHLLDLGRGEQELHVLRRLLQRLQQAVEGLLRQHVHFVDDVDLGARRHRPVARVLDDLAHVVDAGVRGGVHLDHVDVARIR